MGSSDRNDSNDKKLTINMKIPEWFFMLYTMIFHSILSIVKNFILSPLFPYHYNGMLNFLTLRGKLKFENNYTEKVVSWKFRKVNSYKVSTFIFKVVVILTLFSKILLRIYSVPIIFIRIKDAFRT